jgi:ubiquinone/menaquinone biosynthesis C-methylase UbiE
VLDVRSHTGLMTERRDISAFDRRAQTYDHGWLGRFHRDVADRVASITVALAPTPCQVLDIGCGTGYLLRALAEGWPRAEAFKGIDASLSMIEVAQAASNDARIEFCQGQAEHLPYQDRMFDLVVSTTSFDHWHDQSAGLAECRRVLAANGTLVLADLFSPLLRITLVGTRREKARTRQRVEQQIAEVGLHRLEWRKVYPLIHAVIAHR